MRRSTTCSVRSTRCRSRWTRSARPEPAGQSGRAAGRTEESSMIATLPLKTDYRDRTFPYVTVGLIVANVIVFLYELALGDGLETFVQTFATVPCEVATQCAVPASVNPYATLFT